MIFILSGLTTLHRSKSCAKDQVLLNLIDYLSHPKNVRVILKARENHVTILCLQLHSTQKIVCLRCQCYVFLIYHNPSLYNCIPIPIIFGEAFLRAELPIKCPQSVCQNRHIFFQSGYLGASQIVMPTVNLHTEQVPSTESSALLNIEAFQNKILSPSPNPTN